MRIWDSLPPLDSKFPFDPFPLPRKKAYNTDAISVIALDSFKLDIAALRLAHLPQIHYPPRLVAFNTNRINENIRWKR